MGNANCMVYNKTHKKLVIVTFNYADMLYTRYNNYYTLEPGEKIQVEALGDLRGLRVGIVYDAQSEDKVCMYQRWKCDNASVLTVTYMNNENISTYGKDTISDGTGTFKERDDNKFALTVEALSFISAASKSAGRSK